MKRETLTKVEGFLALIFNIKRDFKNIMNTALEQGVGSIITEEDDEMCFISSGSVINSKTNEEKFHITLCFMTNNKLNYNKVGLVMATTLKKLKFPVTVDLLKENERRRKRDVTEE